MTTSVEQELAGYSRERLVAAAKLLSDGMGWDDPRVQPGPARVVRASNPMVASDWQRAAKDSQDLIDHDHGPNAQRRNAGETPAETDA